LRNGADVTDSDIRAIVKRLDIDGDTQISFSEFKRVFTFPVSVNNLSKEKFFNQSSSNFGRSTFYESRSPKRGFESPLRSSYNTSFSPKRTFSPNRTSYPRRYLSPDRSANLSKTLKDRSVERVNLNRSIDRDYSRTTDLTKSNLTVFNSSSDRFKPSTSLLSNSSYNYLSLEEENFLSYIREIIEVENDIERAKIELALRSDFNVDDAFRIFELDGRGYLTDVDIKYGLNSLEVFPTTEEVSLLIRRYDLRGEGVLSYANFFNMLSPLDREYRRMVENRLPSTYLPRYNKSDVFLSTTKLLYTTLLNLLIRSEARLEAWRQRLNKLPRLNWRNIFDKVDRLGKNYLNESDVIIYLIEF
jgi:Ca2+-binding EF-hand superfamily protein